MTYNLTNLTASTNFLEYSIAVNQLTYGFLFVILIVLIGFVSYSRLEGNEAQRLMASSFFCLILAIVLQTVGVIQTGYVFIFLAIMLFGLFAVILSK